MADEMDPPEPEDGSVIGKRRLLTVAGLSTLLMVSWFGGAVIGKLGAESFGETVEGIVWLGLALVVGNALQHFGGAVFKR